MKAMRSLKQFPEWMSDRLDGSGKEIKGVKNKKESEPVIPFSNMSDFQVHAYAVVNGAGRIDARHGKGSETLSINMGFVKNIEDVESKARAVYYSILGEKV